MKDSKYTKFGASVIGPLQIKNGLPNQDSFITRSYSWGNIVVVADGLGSKQHPEIGSAQVGKAVCESVVKFTRIKNSSLEDLFRLINSNWMINISPYYYRDCSTTCLIAIQIQDRLILARLGDGMIAAASKDNEIILLAEDKDSGFSNMTNCMSNKFNYSDWQIKDLKDFKIKYVILCSDGIADDLKEDSRVSFASSLYKSYSAMSTRNINRDIKNWLKKWPVPKHTDDKSIAGLFLKEISNE